MCTSCCKPWRNSIQSSIQFPSPNSIILDMILRLQTSINITFFSQPRQHAIFNNLIRGHTAFPLIRIIQLYFCHPHIFFALSAVLHLILQLPVQLLSFFILVPHLAFLQPPIGSLPSPFSFISTQNPDINPLVNSPISEGTVKQGHAILYQGAGWSWQFSLQLQTAAWPLIRGIAYARTFWPHNPTSTSNSCELCNLYHSSEKS